MVSGLIATTAGTGETTSRTMMEALQACQPQFSHMLGVLGVTGAVALGLSLLVPERSSVRGADKPGRMPTLLSVLKRPVVALVLVLGVSYTLPDLLTIMEVVEESQPIGVALPLKFIVLGLERIDAVLGPVLLASTILASGWALQRWKDAAFVEWLENKEEDGGLNSQLKGQLAPLVSLLNWLIYALFIALALTACGVDTTWLLTVGGAGSIIVGLATQNLVGNCLAGLGLILTGRCSVGHRISLDSGLTGYVEEVLLLYTRIRDDSGVLITVPNSHFTDAVIRDFTAEPSPGIQLSGREEVIRFTLKFDSLERVPDICRDIRTRLAEDEHVDLEGPQHVLMSSFEDTGVRCEVKVTVQPNVDYMPFQDRLLNDIGTIIRGHGADFARPFPHP